MRPLVLFGGTFDPPHRRHVEVAEAARDILDADEVLFMVARANPQRTSERHAPAEDRLAMTRLAIEGRRALRASDLEIRREGPSYTVDTLRALASAGEKRPLRLLIGSDQALNLRTWREPDAIIAHAPPAIVLRPPHTRASFMHEAERRGEMRLLALLLPIDPVDCSSTDARKRLESNQPVDDLLAPAVSRYIRERQLYR